MDLITVIELVLILICFYLIYVCTNYLITQGKKIDLVISSLLFFVPLCFSLWVNLELLSITSLFGLIVSFVSFTIYHLNAKEAEHE